MAASACGSVNPPAYNPPGYIITFVVGVVTKVGKSSSQPLPLYQSESLEVGAEITKFPRSYDAGGGRHEYITAL